MTRMFERLCKINYALYGLIVVPCKYCENK